MFSSFSKKNFSNNFIYFGFIFFVIMTAYFSNVFKAPENKVEVSQKNLKLYPESQIAILSKLTFSNKNGSYNFEKTDKSEVSPWEMLSPRAITASSSFFEKIYSLLQTSNIKKVYPDDKINYTNFSLEKPLATLELTFKNNTQNTVYIGLLNTIDKSLYLKIKGKDGIYHVDSPDILFENLTIIDLIESQIFTLDLNNISKISLYKGKKTGPTFFEIYKKENIWYSKSDKEIDPNVLDNFIGDISTLKSSFILDKQTEVQKKSIANAKKNPEYTLEIEDSKQNKVEYNISGLIKEMPSIDLKGEPYFIISSSINSTAYLVKKEFYNLFDLKIDKFIKVSPSMPSTPPSSKANNPLQTN